MCPQAFAVCPQAGFGSSCPQALAVCPQALRCVPSGWFQSILCSAHSCMMWFISSLVMTLVGSCGSIPSVVSWIIILFLTVSCHFVLGLPALLKSALTLDPFSFIEIFFIGSSSLSLSMCAYSVICFLINLCESCHDKIHEDGKQHKIVKTSNGYEIEPI